ncbi:GGDEF domain-containing protein [Kitasatospora paracochleata]|uniref:Diguanylate cyclase (GGDEF)-like protein n=1 Tax=Kitasatospora paracochleata TaxID=58354 RepID=A0ABT1J643_9ACTN|nr:GGDEF domain-containing protein [Kitasatospora paracochleata]MCP2312906.1 diguanylate cyclase (GGDEF)-like protein [Kitasatospora paracochleata]
MDLAPILAAGLPLLGWTTHGTYLARRLATARRDPLTGLLTRDGFTTRAERLIRSHPDRTTVLLVDLDDFKAVNDTHGHAAGDTVLKATADRLTAWCGSSGLAARLGGDEFAVVALDSADRIPQLHTALRRPIDLDGLVLDVSASVGASHPAALLLTEALSAADRDMYAHKPGSRSSRRG